MTIEQMAGHWARYWTATPTGMSIADNAPTNLWRFVLSHDRYDREMIYDALISVATQKPVRVPSTAKQLRWFASKPEAMESCDSVLKEAKSIPRNFANIVEQGYKRELYAIVTELNRYLSKELQA